MFLLKVQDKERLRGLKHAIMCAKKIVGEEPFAVMLPDMLISKDNFNSGESLKEMKISFEKKDLFDSFW